MGLTIVGVAGAETSCLRSSPLVFRLPNLLRRNVSKNRFKSQCKMGNCWNILLAGLLLMIGLTEKANSCQREARTETGYESDNDEDDKVADNVLPMKTVLKF